MELPNLYTLLDTFNLDQAYSFLLTKNPSNNLSYHNLGHIEKVTLFAYLGCQHHELPNDVTRDIMLAALFHDFNHSGGKLKDSENILRAKEGLKQYLNDTQDSDVKVEFVNYLIDITEYPYTIETSKLTIHQKILRDSDILQSFYMDNYIQDVVLGLALEMGKTPEEAINGQLGFLANLSFGTEWATNLFNEKKLDTIQNLSLIKRFIS